MFGFGRFMTPLDSTLNLVFRNIRFVIFGFRLIGFYEFIKSKVWAELKVLKLISVCNIIS